MKNIEQYNPKQILEEILNSFCLSSENLKKVYKLSGIKAQLYNGKRSNEQLKKLLLRAISEEKAKLIINEMPHPFIETYHGKEYLKEFIDGMIKKPKRWEEEVLSPIKLGRIENITKGYSIIYK